MNRIRVGGFEYPLDTVDVVETNRITFTTLNMTLTHVLYSHFMSMSPLVISMVGEGVTGRFYVESFRTSLQEGEIDTKCQVTLYRSKEL